MDVKKILAKVDVADAIYAADVMCEKGFIIPIFRYSESCFHPHQLSALTLADPLDNSINITLNLSYIRSFEKHVIHQQNRPATSAFTL